MANKDLFAVVSANNNKTYRSPSKKLESFICRACFWEVWESFGGIFGEVWGTCLGGFWKGFEIFLDSFREDLQRVTNLY